ncbi:MAG TPA: transcriptional regulator [Lacipirellulaceae bacterium]|nr:transcriptional regulator [Lacipirellulaceae bacterium]
MSHSPEIPAAAQDLAPADLMRLADAIHALPEPYAVQLAPLVDAVVESTKRRRRILTLVQDALSQLRLDMKYLMFDLEATRRERDEYRLRLEE